MKISEIRGQTYSCNLEPYDAIVAAVNHREFNTLDLNQYSKNGATVVYDIKGALPKDAVDARL